MVKVNLNKDGVVTMSYIVKDDVGADEGMKKFMMILSIFQNNQSVIDINKSF